MCRQIKLRGWDLDYKVMDSHFYLHSSGMPYETPDKVYDTPNIEIEESPNIIIMQFTGLFDKNGKEIYEGDVCCVEKFGNRSVKIDSLLGTTFTNTLGIDCAGYDYVADNDTFEVIGNIYENPELIVD